MENSDNPTTETETSPMTENKKKASKTERKQTMPKAQLQCIPGRPHVIDRRKPLTDAQGVVQTDRAGNPLQNFRCVCGRLNGDSANYNGGEFTFVKTDDEAEAYSEA